MARRARMVKSFLLRWYYAGYLEYLADATLMCYKHAVGKLPQARALSMRSLPRLFWSGHYIHDESRRAITSSSPTCMLL